MQTQSLLVSLIISFVACRTPESPAVKHSRIIMEDTLRKLKQLPVEAFKSTQQTAASRLLGIWTDGNSENASLNIGKDSIYYVEQFASYKYSLAADSIKIFYPHWTFTGAVCLKKDTLIISSEDGTAKYLKFVE